MASNKKNNKLIGYIKKSEYFIHETKKKAVTKFLLVLAILIAYFIFVSTQYGLKEGMLVTLLTWSFFVFCTPIADAGFLLDFPVRLITKIRMIYSEIAVWIVAALINVYALLFQEEIYQKTEILKLFQHIITTPVPFWAIIILSAIGTFLSIYFGDELIDVAKHEHRKQYHKHKHKYMLVVGIFIIAIIVLLYYYLLNSIGITIPV